jgi:hypothetical protein
MKPSAQTDARVHLPLLKGLLPITPGQLPHDIVAGITLAALGIPEVMGYTPRSPVRPPSRASTRSCCPSWRLRCSVRRANWWSPRIPRPLQFLRVRS